MRPFAFVLLCALPLVCGCHIESKKNGNNENVSIGTPFGSMDVKTDKGSALAGLGITPYPGATVVHKKNDSDDGAADVSLSFGQFQLGVHALELQTADPQSKVLAFYRSDLARYGAVLSCRGNSTMGQPTRTAAGLTCDTDSHSSHRGDGDQDLQLRAGSPQHQHVVSVEDRDGGTHIGLVALELPGGGHDHGPGDRE